MSSRYRPLPVTSRGSSRAAPARRTRCHSAPPASAGSVGEQLGGPQHRGDDVLVARAAAQVAGDRLARLLRGRRRVVAQVGGDRGEEARACRSRTAARGTPGTPAAPGPARRRAARQPSTVVTAAPSTVTANIRQERTGSPSSSTVQAPQTPCSQPTWVPVSRRSWRRTSDSSRRAGTSTSCGAPLTVNETRTVRRSRHAAAHLRPGLVGPRAPDEHVREMAAVVGAGVDVGLRLDGRVDEAAGRSPASSDGPPTRRLRSTSTGPAPDADQARTTGRRPSR